MTSLGELVDKLSVTNLKLWHTQDEIQGYADKGVNVPAAVAERQISLNVYRNRLMSEIDKVSGGPAIPREKL